MLAPLALLAVLVAAVGCDRRAPGPAECRALALAATGMKQREDARSREQLEQLDTITRECLVTPYDRTFVRCMEESRHYPACRRDFTRRRAEPAVR